MVGLISIKETAQPARSYSNNKAFDLLYAGGYLDTAKVKISMDNNNKTLLKRLSEIWSSTNFESNDILRYAMPRIITESRHGVAILSMAALFFLAFSCALSLAFNFGSSYVYTYGLLAGLALHIYLSTKGKLQLPSLYLLAIALLVICGSSLVLIAQQSGKLDIMIFSGVAALFMLVPIVPWGLREALSVILAIYFMFTTSLVTTGSRFSGQDFWLLQILMLFAAAISITLVIRALLVRKHDLRVQFHLEQAHSEMQNLLHHDPLTGAWNRRFLENKFSDIVKKHYQNGKKSYFVMFDIDNFKIINDTYGHHEGDLVLQAAVSAFTSLLHQDEYIIRMGGDEFALLLCNDVPEVRVNEGLQTLRDYYEYARISVGILAIPHCTQVSLNEVYKMADEAQYQAKHSGGNRVVNRQFKANMAPDVAFGMQPCLPETPL